jgi:hypothetical protein
MRANNVIQFPHPHALNPYSGVGPFTYPHSLNPYAGYGQTAPEGEGYADWVAQEFMTDAVFAQEEIEGAMDRAWGDAVSRGLILENAYFAGVDAFQDESTGLWAIKLTYYVPPEQADPTRVPGYKKGFPWWGYLGIGLGAVAVVTTVVLIAKRRKPRRRKS